jgi:hypothetical protein
MRSPSALSLLECSPSAGLSGGGLPWERAFCSLASPRYSHSFPFSFLFCALRLIRSLLLLRLPAIIAITVVLILVTILLV